MPHTLIIAPYAFFPIDYGNKYRIKTIIDFFRKQGHRVSFLYVSPEFTHLTPATVIGMYRHVENLYIYPCENHKDKVKNQILVKAAESGLPCHPDFHNIPLDGWYADGLENFVAAIHEKDPIDNVVVNYIWLSKVLENLPEGVTGILETIDIFTDRYQKVQSTGQQIYWFSLSKEDEQRGLNRADLILAITDEDRYFFQSISQKPVLTIGHIGHEIEPTNVSYDKLRRQKLAVGFVAGLNPHNVKAAVDIAHFMVKRPSAKFSVIVCGSVCRGFTTPLKFANYAMIGFVDDIQKFYEEIDLVINVVESGTGLKIKTIEGLENDRPVVTTLEGGSGLLSPFHFHRFLTAEEALVFLGQMAEVYSESMPIIHNSCRQLYTQYRLRVKREFEKLKNIKLVIEKFEEQKNSVVHKDTELGVIKILPNDASDDPTSEFGVLFGFISFHKDKIFRSDMHILDIRPGNFWGCALMDRILGPKKITILEWHPDRMERVSVEAELNPTASADFQYLGFSVGDKNGYTREKPDGGLEYVVIEEWALEELLIPAMTPESFNIPKVDFIRINLEGISASEFNRFMYFVKQYTPPILLSASSQQQLSLSLFLNALGYKIVAAAEGICLLCIDLDIED